MIARILILTCLAAAPLMAQAGFPGLQAILTPAEWKRAGLDRLTPDQIGVIDAALIRHQAATTAAINPGSPEAPAGATPAEAALHRARYWENFGRAKVSDWRNEPPMKAKVTGWQGANRFALDTGQVCGSECGHRDPLQRRTIRQRSCGIEIEHRHHHGERASENRPTGVHNLTRVVLPMASYQHDAMMSSVCG